MKTKYLQLFLWHLLFFVLFYISQELILDKNIDVLKELLEFKSFYLEISSLFSFFVYTLGAYLVLLKSYNKKWFIIGSLFLLTSLAGILVRYASEELIAPTFFGFRNYREGYSLIYYFLDNLYYVILHGSFGIIFFFIQYSKYKEQQQQSVIIESQKTQLTYLRSQINPHFLFNTLNNIYSLVYQKSDNALKSVEKLTVMLRYSLYEQAEKVPLGQEIQQIYNFIELERMRYDYDLQLELEIVEDARKFKVPPFLLIPFVENAFKHGDLKQPLSIILEVKDEILDFQVKNAVKVKQKDQVGGIGLENIRKRLELIYGEKHTLEVEQTEEQFEIQLKIRGTAA